MPHEYLNPPGLFHHPNYTRVLPVEKPSKLLIYIAGQTPADDNYQPLHPGDLRAQYAAVLDGLTLQLKAAGATWDNVVFRRSMRSTYRHFSRCSTTARCRCHGT